MRTREVDKLCVVVRIPQTREFHPLDYQYLGKNISDRLQAFVGIKVENIFFENPSSVNLEIDFSFPVIANELEFTKVKCDLVAKVVGDLFTQFLKDVKSGVYPRWPELEPKKDRSNC